MTDFNPNEACAPNNHYFGFPYEYNECPLVLVSMPWDVTTSYRAGAAHGPQAILDASVQLDFFDFEIADAWKLGIGTYPVAESR
ncbi:MAG: arginase family protein, partial [Bacteroidales bacterium]|nr:arginase family protein [Bacteroidales bacterium]